ncbi:MAG TPA: ATP-binding protein [Bdellovibrio sp.]|uniref:ATP-binding protein n=1 Tax=Bdellovibrio sp. TaxID=28201 RepID=UPI002EFD5D13
MNNSLKTRLLKNIMLSLVLAWALTLMGGYFMTQKTLNDQQDMQLKQIAQSLSHQVFTQGVISIQRTESIPTSGGKDIEFQIWREDKMIGFSENAPTESLSETEGYSQHSVEQKQWRVFSSHQNDSRIMVGQDLNVRQKLIRGMIFSSLWPMLLALPIIGLILWLAVSLGLKPLSNLADAIQKQSPTNLSPIQVPDLPSEVIPVVQSLNNLLLVVDNAMTKEKEFTDNAAHELRTPLAGIKAQVEAALRSDNEEEQHKHLVAINHGVDRTSRIVSQLLALARLEPENLQVNFSSIDLNSLVAQAIAKWTPQALAKNIDLGMEATGEYQVRGDTLWLDLMISNLIDNAIRYSPAHSKVDIELTRQNEKILVIITDNGPGIPKEDRERVFDRFVRLKGHNTEGSGIGLAVVKKIADLHEVKIILDTPTDHGGLKVTLVFAGSL